MGESLVFYFHDVDMMAMSAGAFAEFVKGLLIEAMVKELARIDEEIEREFCHGVGQSPIGILDGAIYAEGGTTWEGD